MPVMLLNSKPKTTVMSDDQIKQIPIKDLVSEDGAHELATSADMKPYLEYLKAEIQGHDTAPHLRTIAELPLHKRYVWRVASALKWGFADFDDETVGIDEQTLSPEDFAKVRELLKFRPVQFCLFLKALLGAKEMERIMAEAIAMAKQGT
jgi:hypothetical protein